MNVETAKQLKILLCHRSDLSSMLARNGADAANILESKDGHDQHNGRNDNSEDKTGVGEEIEIELRQVEVADEVRRVDLLDVHFDQDVQREEAAHGESCASGEVGEALGAVQSCVDLLRRDQQAIDRSENKNDGIEVREEVSAVVQ